MMFKFAIYLASTGMMYMVLKQEDGKYVDYGMLGNVEKVDLWKNYPCVTFPKYNADLYVIKFAYHAYELVFCIIFNR